MIREEVLNYFKGDELATDVFLSKYSLNREETPDQMHSRLAKEFSRVDRKYDNLDNITWNKLSYYGRHRDGLTEKSIYNLFKDFKYIIPGGSTMQGLGSDKPVSLSNCFVISPPEDNVESIVNTARDMAQIYKRRGGVGIDISKLRPNGSKVENAANTSSGAVSFMDLYSKITEVIGQQGRRGALMISIDINHPDVEEFAKVKRDLSKLTGANISIRLNDDFIKAVEDNKDYILSYPTNYSFPELMTFKESYNILNKVSIGKETVYYKRIKAKDLWNTIIESAWKYAEPGIFNWSRLVNYDPTGVYEELKPISTNPCFRGDMKIFTPNGYKTFKELDGKELEFIDSNNNIVNGRVWSNGVKPIFDVSTWNNKHIYCTEDHRFMTVDGEDLPISACIGKRLMPRYKINNTVSIYTKLGFIQGDGNLTRLNSGSHLGLEINIGENDGDIADLFNTSLNSNRTIYTKEFTELLRVLKFDAKVLPERGLPETINNWSKIDISSFLKGLWSANGSVIKDQRVAFKTTSHLLVNSLKSLLKELYNIDAYITCNKEKEVIFPNGTYTCKNSYDLNISSFRDVKSFIENIGFVHTYKMESLISLLLSKAPKVRNVSYIADEEVFDFNLDGDNHWGIVEGVIVHNCGELGLSSFDSCRLICTNLYSLIDKPFTKEATFNKDLAYKIFYECQVLADDLVDLELEAIDRILVKVQPEFQKLLDGKYTFDERNYFLEQQSEEFKLWWKIREIGDKGRRTGTGITGYADMLAALGVDYGNEVVTNEVFKLKLEAELDATIDMAIIRGAFPSWDVKKEFPNKEGILSNGNNWYKFITDNYLYQSERMILHGRRNSGISTVAPTGTVSLLTQTTSGIEPLFQPYYIRRKKCNPGEKPDFIDNNKVGFKEFTVLHPKFKDWYLMNCSDEMSNIDILSKRDLQLAFELSPWYNQIAGDINWEKRINTQSIIQKYISSSISSTVNLPKDTPKEVVEKLYLTAFDKGLKGLTVYIDGSRSGILVNNSDNKKQEFKDHSAPKRPKELKANIHIIKSKGKRYAVVIGLLENKPYEVFVFNTLNSDIKDCSGKITKVERGHYRFTSESLTIENLDESGNTELERACAVYTSMLLRHGANIHYVNNTARKIDDSITSFVSAMSRVLAKYDTIIEEEKCPECGGRLVKEAGCCKCLDCGYSKCN